MMADPELRAPLKKLWWLPDYHVGRGGIRRPGNGSITFLFSKYGGPGSLVPPFESETNTLTIINDVV